MPSLRTYLAVALLGLCLSASQLFAAEPPRSADIQSSLDSLAERQLPEAEQLAIKQTLEKTLALLGEKADSEQRLDALVKQLQQAPRIISEAERDYERLKNSSPTQANLRYGKSALPQLEQLLADRNTQLNEWQKQIIDANSLVITAQTRPVRAQAEISSNQTRSQEINNVLKSGRDANKPLSSERRDQLSAELAKLDAQTQMRRQELAGNSLLQELGNSQRTLLEERIKRIEQELLDLQNLVNEKRRNLSEQTVAEQSREAEKAGSGTVLARESALNLKLSDYLLRATDRLNELTRLNLQTKQQLDSLNQSDQALAEQISVLQGSLLLSRILYKQQQALPTLQIDSSLPDQIADLRLYQFELNQQRENINNPNAYVDQLLGAAPGSAVDNLALHNDLLDIINTRRELIDRLNRELNALLNESITLQLNQKQLQTTAETLRDTLDEQMFWIPSNKPLDLEWFKSAPRLLERQIAESPWGANLRQLGAGLTERPLLFLPLLLLIIVLLWRRGFLYRKLRELHQDIGHFKRDSQLHTPMAIMLNMLLALPGTLFLALCGFALQMDARGQNVNLGDALFQMAQAWLVFYTLYRILTDAGVAELHFRWGRPQAAFLHKQVRRLGLVVMALVAVVTVAKHQPASLGDDVIGLAVVLSCYVLMVWLLYKLLLSGPAREHASVLRTLIGIALSLLPLALIIAVGLGYYYTALKLSERLIDTLYLLVVWLIIEATFVRGLSVAARRLAYQRAISKREAQSKEGEGAESVVEEPTLDIEQVNQQSLRLIRLALLGAFIFSLYWVWADLISVFAYLDNIALYEYSSGSGDAATLVPISLSDVLGALIIVGITVALGRNLPGLLEVLVLSRLNLAQGSAYATTTLLSYLIVAIGFVTTLSTLGVSWDKLQWLVAALSVGLGFGLQEIFANFISGLIILFERPVRIGDVVTIGNLSGTVSKIRIRATTITDFDRKEIIVPNKTFVTDQLINWSLNDTVTRVIIKIGVAYETDLALARKLMMQAAEENPRVLRDPAPLLFFLTISASTFDYELRFHVRELGDRNAGTDEILTAIALSFREHNVEMAFNQVDVMVKNLQGQEFNLSTGQLITAAAAATKQEKLPPAPTLDPL
ncbi:mechanosensitive channel MscK [Pseudomonas guineae]|uniref:mechanosensitive channel MscK n=1 Tax=Pseudomonas guineae TaxID=425504 RepID=UPI003D085DB0